MARNRRNQHNRPICAGDRRLPQETIARRSSTSGPQRRFARRQPNGTWTWIFGKYRGLPVSQAPASYRRWVLETVKGLTPSEIHAIMPTTYTQGQNPGAIRPGR